MTPEDHKLLSETGKGTAMGELLRRFWMPAVLSRELPEADGAPVRVRLLGEDLVAFRDTKGRVGLLREHCSHRGASLFYGRNGECGLRCWYHGWKYDLDGNCVDMPNVLPGQDFKHRIKHPAYPCVERNGAVWTWMGPRADMPDLPELEWLTVPEDQAFVSKRLQLCNWMQGMDGDLDSSHLAFLHGNPLKARTTALPDKSPGWLLEDPVPKIELEAMPAGLLMGARRRADATSFYWRVNQWFMPGFTTIPLAGDSPQAGHAWVPIDDTKVWTFTFSWHPRRKLSDAELERMRTGSNVHARLIPGTTIPYYNQSNGYAEPDAPPAAQPWMRITDLQAQDMAMTESMGPLWDRTLENTGPSDGVIMRTRRRLIEAARHLRETGEAPRIAPADYRLRPVSVQLPEGASWREAIAEAVIARPETFQVSV